MSSRIPEDAFEAYVAMGAERSYAVLAERYGVSKRAVAKKAAREGWADRLARIEQEARERSDERLVETMEEMRERHMRTLKAMNGRVLAALRDYPLTDGMQALKGAEMVIKLERLIAGEPSERSELAIAEVTRQEMRRFLTSEPAGHREGDPNASGNQRGTDDVGADDW